MKEQLLGLIKKAMLTKNSLELRTLRLIKSEFGEFENAKNAKILDEAAEINILNKMVKERKDSIEKYTEGGRLDLVVQEQEEIEVIKRFLPREATKEELVIYINSLFCNANTIGLKMGDYIKLTKMQYPTADGKLLSEIIKTELQIIK